MNGGSLFTPKKNVYTVKCGTERTQAPSEGPSRSACGSPHGCLHSQPDLFPALRLPPQGAPHASRRTRESGPCTRIPDPGPTPLSTPRTQPCVSDGAGLPPQPFLLAEEETQAVLPGAPSEKPRCRGPRVCFPGSAPSPRGSGPARRAAAPATSPRSCPEGADPPSPGTGCHCHTCPEPAPIHGQCPSAWTPLRSSGACTPFSERMNE